MKKVIFLFLLFFSVFFIYAGDVSNFVILGFSSDGTMFAFGIHGVKDKTYQAYAEIYIVDARSNDFAEHGVFKTSPTKITYAQDSKSVFLALQNRATPYLKKYGISQDSKERILYSKTEDSEDNKTLMFRDFEKSDQYTVVLHAKNNNKGVSSFYITCDVLYADGSKKTYHAGHKDILRHGVKSYSIKKVLLDSSSSTLVFVIEKKEVEKDGDSVRYMVEVVRL